MDRLVIVKLDRIGRSARSMLEIFERLEQADVELVSLNDNLDTSTATGRLIPKLLAVLAEWESDNLGERVKAANEARIRQGKHHGRPPYGYTSADGALRIAPHEAAVVGRIFDAFLSGTSQRQITRDLIAHGIPAPRTNWHQGTISQILRNETYAGRVRFNGEVHDGAHEGIVSPDRWDEAARLLAASARTKGWRGKQPATHLLTKCHLKCGRCGESMVPRTDHDSYVCYGRLRLGTDHCEQRPVKRAFIDDAVLRYFERVTVDIEATREQLKEAMERQLAEVRAYASHAEQEAQRAAERLARVKRAWQDGKLEADDWSDQRRELMEEQRAADAEAARLRKQERRTAEGAALKDVEADALQRLADLRAAVAGEVRDADGIAATRAVLMATFEYFRLHHGPTEDDPAREGYLLIPKPRSSAIVDFDEDWRPVLRKQPLPLPANSDGEGFPLHYPE